MRIYVLYIRSSDPRLTEGDTWAMRGMQEMTAPERREEVPLGQMSGSRFGSKLREVYPESNRGASQ
jgi:hypothetical protein